MTTGRGRGEAWRRGALRGGDGKDGGWENRKRQWEARVGRQGRIVGMLEEAKKEEMEKWMVGKVGGRRGVEGTEYEGWNVGMRASGNAISVTVITVL